MIEEAKNEQHGTPPGCPRSTLASADAPITPIESSNIETGRQAHRETSTGMSSFNPATALSPPPCQSLLAGGRNAGPPWSVRDIGCGGNQAPEGVFLRAD